MELQIRKRTIFLILGIIGIIVLILGFSQLYKNYLKPVKSVYINDVPFTFRRDVRRALKVDLFPKEELLHELFTNYRVRNITILFKAGTPETNALYELETIELTYKLFRYDDITRGMVRPRKSFNAEEIENYENITREDSVLKIILVPPEFSDETRVSAGGNRIWVYGRTDKEFDLATMKAILSIMNVTNVEDLVN
ncbi:MAG: hypothetical protein GF368_01145 [Candidatus Aenigmarchaeota archaeon]|nr:hypothetical protein [Candidatus Aenigmarchaeota archaeon]